MASINVDVDIDIEDYLEEVSTKDLIEELKSREGAEQEALQAEDLMTMILGYPVFGASNEECSNALLKALGRI